MELPDTEEWYTEMGHLADVLLGAAFADGHYDGSEKALIREFLSGLLEVDDLPDKLIAHLDAFDPEAFELKTTLERLDYTSEDKRRFLLSLVAGVVDADNWRSETETAYVKKVASLIGATDEEFADLLELADD